MVTKSRFYNSIASMVRYWQQSITKRTIFPRLIVWGMEAGWIPISEVILVRDPTHGFTTNVYEILGSHVFGLNGVLQLRALGTWLFLLKQGFLVSSAESRDPTPGDRVGFWGNIPCRFILSNQSWKRAPTSLPGKKVASTHRVSHRRLGLLIACVNTVPALPFALFPLQNLMEDSSSSCLGL